MSLLFATMRNNEVSEMRFLSPDELKPLKGIPWHRVTLWRMERADPPRFPKRTRLGAATFGYIEPVIDEYVLALATGCDEVEATRLAERMRPSMHPELEAAHATS